MADENANIQVEITDAREFHCFRLLLNPNGHMGDCTSLAGIGLECSCGAPGSGTRLEVMLHARSLVDLIHKCSLALCDWQAQTSRELIDKLQRYAG